jgi:hypothetical protein
MTGLYSVEARNCAAVVHVVGEIDPVTAPGVIRTALGITAEYHARPSPRRLPRS